MRRSSALAFLGLFIALALLPGCDAPNSGGSTTSVAQAGTATTEAGAGDSAAATYCTDRGGKVVTRYPTYAADSSNPLRLAGSLQFCQFTAQDKSMIAISLDTLYTEQPTLPTLAYLQKPPMGQSSSPGANPASVYCSKLGGSVLFGGVSPTGGGWVSDDKNDPFYVLEARIFPDLSIIDSWGLTYHSNGTIRGTDLSKVIRYQQPSAAPGPFGR